MMSLLDAIKEKILLCDGAMGTQLQLAGIASGGCGEYWNIEHPEKIHAIQKTYADAGSDCLITNTFGGGRIMLKRHGHAQDVPEINKAAARIARGALGKKKGFVLGDMGPFGGVMEPYGEIPQDSVREAFLEQAQALIDGGVDAIIVETQTSLDELKIGIDCAREAGAQAVIGSMAYDVTLDETETRTMMGVDPEQAAEFMQEIGVDIIALNCGTGMDMQWAQKTVARYKQISGLPTMAQPNAGLPVLEKMKVVYKETPEQMAEGIPALIRAGANIIGGCCGSTPAHISMFRKIIDEANTNREALAENSDRK